ncbi:hypothetical protein Lepto7376_0287 [[Leptolyngbya] sp. PCC 7376]|nr:hypothetical protein Lepto7376_0287 [[Leptolyngbya] sp. PCC 7376]
MSTASKFLLINAALVNIFLPSGAIASVTTGEAVEMTNNQRQIAMEVMFEPANGGECRGDDQCAAGGAY